MIEIVYHTEKAFIYDINDWAILRKEYRIIGEIIGATQYVPALPIALLPEEAIFLIKENIVKLVKYNCISNHSDNKEEYEHLKKELLLHQKEIYLDLKKNEIEKHISQIVKGKRKKGDTRSEDEIMKEELAKPVNVNENTILWPILLKSVKGEKNEVPITELEKQTTPVRTKVYADLWKKNYFITSGEKFGGDFLVYAGDPIQFHAIYIIRCMASKEIDIHPTEIIAFGRLGTSVKKKAILAALNENNDVDYITLNWIDS